MEEKESLFNKNHQKLLPTEPRGWHNLHPSRIVRLYNDIDQMHLLENVEANADSIRKVYGYYAKYALKIKSKLEAIITLEQTMKFAIENRQSNMLNMDPESKMYSSLNKMNAEDLAFLDSVRHFNAHHAEIENNLIAAYQRLSEVESSSTIATSCIERSDNIDNTTQLHQGDISQQIGHLDQ